MKQNKIENIIKKNKTDLLNGFYYNVDFVKAMKVQPKETVYDGV